MKDCYEQIRRIHKVPAYLGVRVKQGNLEGALVESQSNQLQWLLVNWDGEKSPVLVHPGLVEYIGVKLCQ